MRLGSKRISSLITYGYTTVSSGDSTQLSKASDSSRLGSLHLLEEYQVADVMLLGARMRVLVSEPVLEWGEVHNNLLLVGLEEIIMIFQKGACAYPQYSYSGA